MFVIIIRYDYRIKMASHLVELPGVGLLLLLDTVITSKLQVCMGTCVVGIAARSCLLLEWVTGIREKGG